MKHKTSELTGAALDWAVATAADYKPVYVTDEPGESYWASQCPTALGYLPIGPDGFSPSSDWAQGGPIIEREGISTVREWHTTHWMASTEVEIGPHDRFSNPSFGDTPLIAAMRFYVTSKLGDTVEMPEV